MGILVPGFGVDHLGITLPEAYIAVSKHSIIISPRDSDYDITTQYCIWASHRARLDGKTPLMHEAITFASDSLIDLYAAIYARIKERFPGCTDVIEDVASA